MRPEAKAVCLSCFLQLLPNPSIPINQSIDVIIGIITVALGLPPMHVTRRQSMLATLYETVLTSTGIPGELC